MDHRDELQTKIITFLAGQQQEGKVWTYQQHIAEGVGFNYSWAIQEPLEDLIAEGIVQVNMFFSDTFRLSDIV